MVGWYKRNGKSTSIQFCFEILRAERDNRSSVLRIEFGIEFCSEILRETLEFQF